MKVYLVRHAQTNYNEFQLCNDDPSVDVHLTPEGVRQATLQSEKLKNITFDHIFVSELKRTRQTAVIINRFHLAPLAADSRLNDNRTGFEGKPLSDYFAARNSAPHEWTARFNGGESIEDVKVRVENFITELKLKNYDSVLIVTSQAIVRAFYGIVNNLPTQEAWKLVVENSSCFELELS